MKITDSDKDTTMADDDNQSETKKDPASLKNGSNGHSTTGEKMDTDESPSSAVAPNTNGIDSDKDEKPKLSETNVENGGGDDCVVTNGDVDDQSKELSAGDKDKAIANKSTPETETVKECDSKTGEKCDVETEANNEKPSSDRARPDEKADEEKSSESKSNSKPATDDNDLEKLKTDGGLKMQLDDGETFEVQMISSGDEDSSDDDDDDVEEGGDGDNASSSLPPSVTTAGVSHATETAIPLVVKDLKMTARPPSSQQLSIPAGAVRGIAEAAASATRITIVSSGASVKPTQGTTFHQPAILSHGGQVYRDSKGTIVRKPIPVAKSSDSAVVPVQVLQQGQTATRPSVPSNEELAIEFNKKSRKKLTINNLIDALKEFGLDLEYLRESDNKNDGEKDSKSKMSDGKDKPKESSVEKKEVKIDPKCSSDKTDKKCESSVSESRKDDAGEEKKEESKTVEKKIDEGKVVSDKNDDATSKSEDKPKDEKASEKKDSDEVVIESDDDKDLMKKGDEEDEDMAEHGDVAKKLRPVAKFLYFTGLGFTRENVYSDLVHATDRRHKAGKLTDVEIHGYQQMRKRYHRLRHKNKILRPRHVRVCKRCPFSTESKSAMYLHRQQGHLDDKKVIWSCALCDFDTKMVQAFTFHMEAEHAMTAQPLSRPQFFSCTLCSYTSSTKSHMTKHMNKCEKQFVAEKHQFPLYDDINFIFRALPGPLIKVPLPAQPAQVTAKNIQIRQFGNATVNKFVAANQKVFPVPARGAVGTRYVPVTPVSLPPLRPSVTMSSQVMSAGSRASRYPNQTAQQFISSTIQQMKLVTPIAPSSVKPTSVTQPIVIKDTPPSKIITKPPPPNQGVKRPMTVANLTGQPKAKSAKYSYEVCEICGGFVLDRTALRLHFAMAHNINLREDALDVDRTPPLSCDFCTSRFFTFQGLSLHKARSNHARADQALCHICNTLTSDMPQHIKNAHNIVPNQLNTIRICPVCGQCVLNEKTETHIERVHSIKLEKPSVSMAAKPVYGCSHCSAQFTERSLLNLHIRKGHPEKAAPSVSPTPTSTSNVPESKPCPICGALIKASGYNKHVLVAHCKKKLKVKLKRCDNDGEGSEEDQEEDDGDDEVEEADETVQEEEKEETTKGDDNEDK